MKNRRWGTDSVVHVCVTGDVNDFNRCLSVAYMYNVRRMNTNVQLSNKCQCNALLEVYMYLPCLLQLVS